VTTWVALTGRRLVTAGDTVLTQGSGAHLFTRYCCALDNGEVETVVDCFTVDAILRSPMIDISGRNEIRAFAGRFARRTVPFIAPGMRGVCSSAGWPA
jgi:hypothetical protein